MAKLLCQLKSKEKYREQLSYKYYTIWHFFHQKYNKQYKISMKSVLRSSFLELQQKEDHEKDYKKQGNLILSLEEECISEKSNKETFRFRDKIDSFNDNQQKRIKFQAFQNQQRKNLIGQLFQTLKSYEQKIRNLEQQNYQINSISKEVILSKIQLITVIEQKSNKIRQLENQSFSMQKKIEVLTQNIQVLNIQLFNHKRDIEFISNKHFDKQLQISKIRESFQVQEFNMNIHKRSDQFNKSVPNRLMSNLGQNKEAELLQKEIQKVRRQLNDKKIQNKKLSNMYQGLQELSHIQKQSQQQMQRTYQILQKQNETYQKDLKNAQKLFNQLSFKKAKEIIQLTQKCKSLKRQNYEINKKNKDNISEQRQRQKQKQKQNDSNFLD